MATFIITNISAGTVHIGDFLLDIPAGATASISGRDGSEVPGLFHVRQKLLAGLITFRVEYTGDEIASGFNAPPNSVGGDDTQEVAAAELLAVPMSIYEDIAAGAGGAADDATIYAVDSLPFKFRILQVWLDVETPVGASSATLRDEAAGAGQTLATFDTATVGIKTSSSDLGLVVTPSATTGLFLRRSDSGVAARVVLFGRRES